MKLSSRKRKLLVGGVAAALLAGTIGAFAFFTSTGTGTGQGTVGQATAFTIAQTGQTGTVFPGTTTETVTVTVTNPGAGFQELHTVTATVNSSGGNITQGGTPVVGCLSSWFSVTSPLTPNTAVDLAPGGTADRSTVLSMIDSATPQDACQGTAPDINFTAS